jgi:hypothetical protein
MAIVDLGFALSLIVWKLRRDRPLLVSARGESIRKKSRPLSGVGRGGWCQKSKQIFELRAQGRLLDRFGEYA